MIANCLSPTSSICFSPAGLFTMEWLAQARRHATVLDRSLAWRDLRRWMQDWIRYTASDAGWMHPSSTSSTLHPVCSGPQLYVSSVRCIRCHGCNRNSCEPLETCLLVQECCKKASRGAHLTSKKGFVVARRTSSEAMPGPRPFTLRPPFCALYLPESGHIFNLP